MSTPKEALNKRVKISNTGRPYVDVADLVKTRLDRIDKARGEQGKIVDRDSPAGSERSDNPASANNNTASNGQDSGQR